MKSLKKYRRPARWAVAWGFAVLVHALVFGVIALSLYPDYRITVSSMVPGPGETVELYPAQGVAPSVFFGNRPETLNAASASLYKIGEAVPEFVSHGRLRADRPFALQFDAVSEAGEYEIVVETQIVDAPYFFDGEYSGSLPSGDGVSGGAFRARFAIARRSREVFTAKAYDPAKPQINESEPAPAHMPKQSPSQPPAPKAQKKPKPEKKPHSPSEPAPQQPSETPKSAAIAQAIAPAAPLPPTPSGTIFSPQNLAVGPLNLAPALAAQSARIAQETFNARDVNVFVQAANLEKSRYEAAYNPDGPVIKQGEQGNSLSHDKNVAEYLALMHKEIHRLWAHDYLLRLDTVFRRPGSRLNDPDLEAVLELTLNSRGDVDDVRIVRSSGITEYDSEAIHVAWNASPKLPIPNEMRSNNGKSYIHWTFWRDGRQCGVFGVKVFKYEGSKRDALDFSLRAVQAQEKKLGLEPSVVPGVPATPQKSSEPPIIPKSETINPLDD